jgi:hypothetical protein
MVIGNYDRPHLVSGLSQEPVILEYSMKTTHYLSFQDLVTIVAFFGAEMYTSQKTIFTLLEKPCLLNVPAHNTLLIPTRRVL